VQRRGLREQLTDSQKVDALAFVEERPGRARVRALGLDSGRLSAIVLRMASPVHPLALILLLTACGGEPRPEPIDVHGSVQKGPFILGSAVTAVPLDTQGMPTGLQFDASAQSDLGEFTLVDVPVGPIAILATGFHFDEITGTRSLAPINLRALHVASADATIVNVNVLTHISEPRARELLSQGQPISEALAEAEAEAVDALQIGPSGLMINGSLGQANVLGPDTDDNAYLLAVSAVIAQAAHLADPEAPDAALQELLSRIAVDLRQDGDLSVALVEQLATAETNLDPGAVESYLSNRAAELGLPNKIPDLNRALDQDQDGIANASDNCPRNSNIDQIDEDADGVGDACDECLNSAGDLDGDGIQDNCDSCPDIANPGQKWTESNPHPDADGDGLGNECDSCPLSAKTGETPGENCCDPREEDCTRWAPSSAGLYQCHPEPDGMRFSCWSDPLCLHSYGSECLGCGPNVLCLPPGGLPGCLDKKCFTKWCTVGEPTCELSVPGAECIPWFLPGESPQGLGDLGICAVPDSGPCAGKVGHECAEWGNF